ncbi:LamG-like jellyroll fold domain-containing protein [Deinococcus sp. ME38]|uniref:LamG-like jellyroll fold domain-containing protein n=1 Tax=Deinococcus sp. ME38 TaxID=3400344 RepID=UPI003B596FA3
MANSVTKLTGVTFTGSLPRLERDGIIPPTGALWLFDAAVSAPGSLAVNGTWENLVRGSPAATIKNTTGLSVAGNGLVFAGTGGYLSAGDSYNLTGKSLIMTATIKYQSITSGFSATMGRGTSGGASCQFMLGHLSSASTAIRSSGTVKVGGASDPAAGHIAVATAGTIYHIAMAVQISGADTVFTRYLNGTQVGQETVTGGTGLWAPPSANGIGIGRYDGNGSQSAYRGTIYRLYAEDLTASGRTPAQVVAAGYAIATQAGRYS